MITLKSRDEIKLIREGGKILSAVLNKVVKAVKPGVTTAQLDEIAQREIELAGGDPSFKGYGEGNNSYPAALCTSVNEQIVHGIPSEYILKQGDIIGLDIGMRYPKKNGLYTDMAMSVGVGKIDSQSALLIKVTRQALNIWIKHLKPGVKIMSIARKVQKHIEDSGFGVVRDLVGHGVGHKVHEDPQIPNYFAPNMDFELKEGMVLAFEPMVSAGDYRIVVEDDGWTYSTADGSLAAHFEHTVAITKLGCEVLTR